MDHRSLSLRVQLEPCCLAYGNLIVPQQCLCASVITINSNLTEKHRVITLASKQFDEQVLLPGSQYPWLLLPFSSN